MRLLHRRPPGLKRWVSTCAILVSHVQSLAILGSLPLEWPLLVQRLLAAVGLDALHIPEVSCLFPSGEGFTAAGGSTQGWAYPLIVCGLAVAALIVLIVAVAIARARGLADLSDSLELALSIAFALPLVTTWRSVVSLARLSAAAPTSQRAILKLAGLPGEFYASQIATFRSAAHRLKALEALAISLISLLLVLQLCLAVHFVRRMHAQHRGTRRLQEKGEWPSELPSPRRIARRCAYLSGRFAAHAPLWELVIWLRQLALQIVAVALDFSLGDAHTLPARSALRSSLAATTLLVLIVAWALQWWHRPYAFRLQNRLASYLFGSSILLLALGLGYSSLVVAEESVAEWLRLLVEALMLVVLLGGLLGGLLVLARDVRATRRALDALDEASTLTIADEQIDAPLAERLRDGTIRLVACAWLMSSESDAVLLDQSTNVSVIRRCQDLPPEAFVPTAVAAELLRRGDRSVLALSYGARTEAGETAPENGVFAPLAPALAPPRSADHTLPHNAACAYSSPLPLRLQF